MKTKPAPVEGAMIRAKRVRLNWSQTKLAELIGRSQMWISTMETGYRGKQWKIPQALTYALAGVQLGITAQDWQDRADSFPPNSAVRVRLSEIAALTRDLESIDQPLTVEEVVNGIRALQNQCEPEVFKQALTRIVDLLAQSRAA